MFPGRLSLSTAFTRHGVRTREELLQTVTSLGLGDAEGDGMLRTHGRERGCDPVEASRVPHRCRRMRSQWARHHP